MEKHIVATLTLLDRLPAHVRAFLRRAQAKGIEIREEEFISRVCSPLGQRLRMIALRGSAADFSLLPEMRRQRLPKRETHLLLPIGIVGMLYQRDDSLVAAIEWIRAPSRACRVADAMRAKDDVAFAAFMQRVVAPMVIDADGEQGAGAS